MFFENLKIKSEDIDGLKMKPVCFVVDLLVAPLTYIYNLNLGTGSFPQRIKHAKVIVLFRGGDKSGLNNYRPISLLPLFSKPTEKLIFVSLSKFFEQSIITPAPFGFRSWLSSETALLRQNEIILANTKGRKITLGLFINLSNEFG